MKIKVKIVKVVCNIWQKFFKQKNDLEEIENFIELHKGNIKVLMNIFQVMFDRTEGKAKMLQCVQVVCSAIGTINKTTGTLLFIEEKLQNIYDELKAEGCLK